MLEKKKRLAYVIETVESGQVVRSRKEFISSVDATPFIKLYDCGVDALTLVNSSTDIKVLMMMLKNLYFDSDVITFDADFKDQICEELKIELRTLYNSTGRLIKLKIITKFGKSRLRINNKMFHKGKVKNERRQPNRNMPKGEGF